MLKITKSIPNFQENHESNLSPVLSFNHKQSTNLEQLSSIVKMVETERGRCF